MKYLMVVLVLVCACEDDERWPPCPEQSNNYDMIPLWIDEACSDRDIDIALTAIDRLNELSSSQICEPIIEVIGTTTVDHSIIYNESKALTCYYYAPDWYDDNDLSRYNGTASEYRNIRLYFFTRGWSDDFRLSLIMHELMHYVGLNGHIDAPDAVMEGASPTKTEYTDADAEMFCNEYNCIN